MKKICTQGIVSLLFGIMPVLMHAQMNVGDSLALVDLYKSTKGKNWWDHTNWLTLNPVSTWYGVTVVNNRVDQLYLYRNNLDGKIPSAIGNLTALKSLNFGSNQLTDSIPVSIGNLVNLKTLNLSFNAILGGNIPSTIGNLTNLQILILYANALKDSIPSSIGNLVNLTDLYLNGNALTGSIPTSIGNLTVLRNFYLQDNKLTGSIPATIGNFVHLTSLNLSYNKLTGSIPSSFGNLVNLTGLYLESNQLTDSIPASIGTLADLTGLNFNNNKLTGSIPSTIGNLAKLNYLDLSFNKLTGGIPSSIGNLTSLYYLYLNNNRLTDSIPSSIGNLTSLYYLYLLNNQLTGSIPGSVINLVNLYNLFLYNNELSGLIPNPPQLMDNTYAYVYSNRYNFDAFEGVITNYDFLSYVPQKNIYLHINDNTLTVTAGGTLRNNNYKWYKDGVLLKSNTGDSSYHITSPGKYNVAVSNAMVTDLILYSDTIDISVLPVQFISYTATLQKQDVILNWKTAQEINIENYNIERSTDAVNYFTIAAIKAKGAAENYYQYIDSSVAFFCTGKIYYRIKEMDSGGQTQISKTQEVNINTFSKIFISPNPAKDFIYIILNKSGNAIINIYDGKGRTVYSSQITVNNRQPASLNISKLVPGTYFIAVSINGEMIKEKFIKQ